MAKQEIIIKAKQVGDAKAEETLNKPVVWKKLSEEFPPSGKRILLYCPRYSMSFHAGTTTRNGVVYIKYSHGIISNNDELQGGARDYAWTEDNEKLPMPFTEQQVQIMKLIEESERNKYG